MKKVIVVRKGEKIKTVALEGIQFDMLLRTDKLEALFCTFEPGASIGPPYTHIGEEVHVILRGEMEGEIGGRKYLLKEGDVIWYSSIVPHTARNPGKEKAVYFSIISPPTFM